MNAKLNLHDLFHNLRKFKFEKTNYSEIYDMIELDIYLVNK